MVDGYGNVVYNWRVHITGDVVASDNGSATVRATTYFQAINNWEYHGLNASFNAAVGNQESYSSTQGGISVGVNGQQNIAAKDVRISKGHSAQNILVTGYINVTGYAAGKSYATAYVSIPAKPSWSLKFDANGGTNAPGGMTKWWGENLSIPNQIPTRTNYEFLGWNTSGTNNGNYYNPGQAYGTDQNVILKACWKLKSKPPVISSFDAYRSNSSGTLQNDGSYVTLITKWSVDTSIDSSNSLKSLVYSYNDGTAWHSYDASASSGTSGTTKVTFGGYNTSKSYSLRVNVTDKYSNIISERSVGPASFIFDFTSDGRGIGIGQAAPTSGVGITGYPLTLNGGSPIIVSESNIPSKNDEFHANSWFYESLSDGRVHLYGLFQQNGNSGTYHFNSISFPFKLKNIYSLNALASQTGTPASHIGYCRPSTTDLDAYGVNGQNKNASWWLYVDIIGYRQ